MTTVALHDALNSLGYRRSSMDAHQDADSGPRCPLQGQGCSQPHRAA